MEQFPQSKFTAEQIAQWRKDNVDMIKAALPSFEMAPDGTLMKQGEDGSLSEDQLSTVASERKDQSRI